MPVKGEPREWRERIEALERAVFRGSPAVAPRGDHPVDSGGAAALSSYSDSASAEVTTAAVAPRQEPENGAGREARAVYVYQAAVGYMEAVQNDLTAEIQQVSWDRFKGTLDKYGAPPVSAPQQQEPVGYAYPRDLEYIRQNGGHAHVFPVRPDDGWVPLYASPVGLETEQAGEWIGPRPRGGGKPSYGRPTRTRAPASQAPAPQDVIDALGGHEERDAVTARATAAVAASRMRVVAPAPSVPRDELAAELEEMANGRRFVNEPGILRNAAAALRGSRTPSSTRDGE